MVALYQVGRQADTLAVCQKGRQVLIEEMGVESGPELRQAQEAILRSDPALARPVKAAPRMPRQLPSPVPDFTGREKEIGALRDHLTGSGATPICVISGQGGVGKSSLPKIVLLSDPRIAAVPVKECGEPLVDLRTVQAIRVDPRLADREGGYAHVRLSVARST
ncbi:hypothetical protein HD596_000241 [Nonomuraea jabiensis]|uniref:Bacterial transcriptional activator domain-containing protein n=2 Tax=Nonomuraea jabiensis TaxID=882448 RepID=A0A7W9L7I1_9ACTN|nr:hypothetical protein [Nonomuraea jabiensis]